MTENQSHPGVNISAIEVTAVDSVAGFVQASALVYLAERLEGQHA